MAAIVGVAHLVIRVTDWARSARWYEEILGFEKVRADGFSTFGHPGAGFMILLRPTTTELAPSSSEGERLDHVAMHVPTLDALESWQRHLANCGLAVEIEHQPTIGSSITVFDPDGLEIELFTPAAESPLALE